MKNDIQGKDVKLKILNAAKTLFAQKGYEGTTVRQICDEAGVALALVSYHFGGKENVFYALFETYAPSFLQKAYDLADPVADLQSLIREFARFRLAEPELINLLQQEVMMQSPRLEKVQHIVYALWLQLRAILEAGKRQGRFEYESLRHTVHFVVGTLIFTRNSPFLDPVLQSKEDLPVKEEQEDVIRYTISYILNGLKCNTP
ncbi:HTH-type transcriptional repressor NicS [Paenibacillus solanacearum]|uniref:HTH-type transcriptional repressor NicS n=1 Tax=Paenibacillus solanacearum TaxID=2048548 RepID=A0A916NJK8_9BACL|nr:TetR family transcriptional regulator [Paenibacillus solanacearum]CAG7628835.1 HTH-type transcriptional repressor NicS [Paenibacillus solanacearum]